jgi:hypothetical protein
MFIENSLKTHQGASNFERTTLYGKTKPFSFLKETEEG